MSRPLSTTVRSRGSNLLSVLHRPVGVLRLRRMLVSTAPPYRVAVGSDKKAAGGWITTDVTWRCPRYLDATKPWPMPHGSVSHIYADNVIEHLTLEGTRSFLRHAGMALQPGGRLRLVTPDVRALARIFLEGDPETTRIILNRSRAAGLIAEHDVDILRVAFSEHGHHRGYLWDARAIEAELHRAGFGAISFPAVFESQDPVLRGLESREDKASLWTQLVVEASRS